jgi:hypothetical protein
MRYWKFYVGAVVIIGACFLLYRYLNPIAAFQPSTVNAGGTVLVRGSPMAGIRVTYHPQFNIGKVKFTPNGITNSQGKFTLSSGKPGDGAPPGEYIVTFDYPFVTSDGVEQEIDLFKGEYSNPATSQWKVKIKKDSQETFQLN